MGVNELPIQRREISIFNTQTIDKIASSITAYDNALDKYKVFNKLTDNGTVEGIFMEDGELYVNGTWVAAGVLSDAQGKNAWNLDTGDLAMTKGSISLGALSGGGYNFTVTDAGALTMKSGSITLGSTSGSYYFNVSTAGAMQWKSTNSSMDSSGNLTLNGGSINLGNNFIVSSAGAVTIKSGSISLGSSSGTYYFNADTTGAMQWKSANSSMSSTGVLSTTGADIKGTITTVNGNYKTVLQDGFAYFYANNSLIGKIGAALWTNTDTQQNYYGFDLDIPAGAQTGGFYLGTENNASELWVYHRADSKWHSSKAIQLDVGDYYSVLSVGQYGLTADGATIATETWVQQQGYLTSVPTGYATQSWVTNQGYLTSVPSTYATQNWVSSQLSNYVDEQNALYHISGNALALIVSGSTEYTRVNLDLTKWYYVSSTWDGRTGTVKILNSDGTAANLKFYHGVLIAGTGTAWAS